MYEFGVNLKRFEVPAALGGICTVEDSVAWIEDVVEQCMESGLGVIPDTRVRVFPPESLLVYAQRRLDSFPEARRVGFSVGSQAVYREDIQEGGNFGAYTTNLPAAAVAASGVRSALIGHSEERYDTFTMLESYDPEIAGSAEARARANHVVNELVGREVARAAARGLSIMLCVGETAEEKGGGTPSEQNDRVRAVLHGQLSAALAAADAHEADIVIAYEPRWAIGPGRTPPDGAYIEQVCGVIKTITAELVRRELPVVYGGGLKRENAAEVGAVSTVDGGLVALTKFTPPLAFDPAELRAIIELFLQASR